MYAFTLIALVFASRFSYRFLRNQKHKYMNKDNATRVMIVGAGDAGNSIIKEIKTSNFSTMNVTMMTCHCGSGSRSRVWRIQTMKNNKIKFVISLICAFLTVSMAIGIVLVPEFVRMVFARDRKMLFSSSACTSCLSNSSGTV